MPPPASDAVIAWPDGFGTRFTVFVDTEEEFDWARPLSRDSRSVRHVRALPAMHARFADRGVSLTYLVDHPVVADPEAVATIAALLADGRSTVGTQLHAWVNPPFDEDVNTFNSFAGNLPEALEAAKLRVLTGAIETAFGVRPRVYRAGRYGIGPRTARLLVAEGYRIDASIRAAYDYGAQGGPDFTRIGNAAFRVAGAPGLIALPFTTVFTGALRRQGAGLYRALGAVPRARGAAARLGLLSRVSLTPEDMPLPDALEAVRIAVGDGLRLLSFAFHSPSAEPGHTPYVRTAADLVQFHRWWDAVLALLDRLGVRAASLAEILASAEALAGDGSPPLSHGAAGGL